MICSGRTGSRKARRYGPCTTLLPTAGAKERFQQKRGTAAYTHDTVVPGKRVAAAEQLWLPGSLWRYYQTCGKAFVD
jgi:hypothetical protein